MKRRHLGWAALLCLSFLLTGCELVFQAGTGLSGRAFDEYMKSIKPYINYWEKDGMTQEQRELDSKNCRVGGVSPGGIYQSEFDKARQAGETENATYTRLYHEWQRCMIKKDYRFTGKCYADDEISRASPACGAP